MRSSGERGVLVRRGLGFMMVRALSSVGYLVQFNKYVGILSALSKWLVLVIFHRGRRCSAAHVIAFVRSFLDV